MLIYVFTGYYRGRTVDGGQTKILLGRCEHYHMKDDQSQNIQADFSTKSQIEFFCLKKTSRR